MTTSLFQSVFDDLLTLSILGGFVFFVVNRLRKESPKETIEWLKDLVRDGPQPGET